MTTRTITQAQHAQLLGLELLAKRAIAEVDRVTAAAAEILGEQPSKHGTYDVTDFLNYSVGEMLEGNGTTVVDEERPDADLRKALAQIRDMADDPTMKGRPPEEYAGALGRITRLAQDALNEELD